MTLNLAWLLVSDSLVSVLEKLRIYRDFPTQQSLVFTENGGSEQNVCGSKSLVDVRESEEHNRIALS